MGLNWDKLEIIMCVFVQGRVNEKKKVGKRKGGGGVCRTIIIVSQT